MILFLLQIYFNIFKKVFPLKKYDKKDVFSTKLDVLFSLCKIFPETQTYYLFYPLNSAKKVSLLPRAR